MRSRERPFGRDESALSKGEEGSVDSFLLIAPLMLAGLLLFGVFQYALSVNHLTSTATFIGRQIAREPHAENLDSLVSAKLRGIASEVSDFHVMRMKLGERTFIQLVVLGSAMSIGPIRVQPSGKSLTLQDDWVL